jgi:hypothetical protein
MGLLAICMEVAATTAAQRRRSENSMAGSAQLTLAFLGRPLTVSSTHSERPVFKVTTKVEESEKSAH